MDKIQFSQKTQEIRTKYNRIHKILFTYGVFLLIALFAIIKVYAILSSEKDETANENPLKVQKDIKIQEFINKVDLIQKQQTLTGSIALGQFQETKDYIESFNNLLYYK
ncbi:TPA: hypothetical protein DIC40_05490 [Patescibacteria group bacterium]|nr:hypothetical protein [Candidatus Gracilibacteria bacterium]